MFRSKWQVNSIGNQIEKEWTREWSDWSTDSEYVKVDARTNKYSQQILPPKRWLAAQKAHSWLSSTKEG